MAKKVKNFLKLANLANKQFMNIFEMILSHFVETITIAIVFIIFITNQRNYQCHQGIILNSEKIKYIHNFQNNPLYTFFKILYVFWVDEEGVSYYQILSIKYIVVDYRYNIVLAYI